MTGRNCGAHHRRHAYVRVVTSSRFMSASPLALGVFSDNPGAQRLYERHGFKILGRTSDRFRVDKVSLDDTEMTLNVAQI